ncbi:protein of unknown function [Actinokineospora alba]|uniref:DUF397 domain-containing protein n=1 Tax=Actinokineospora alba TaxID=504798 RepID=A0A1H0MZ23_9PSEU|nr:DUF397 domain-containing protein [Actinokineospora alba]TDP68492.1 uncharacterized protein DUF397 [Actinokineospora alba]SDH80227.1 protein of unknown function [Actinokineospora alba]SDO85647.1 protein of unknown function [Actinokineospora alba]
MTVSGLARAEWRKSSRSGAGNDCVELAVGTSATAVRDSKNAEHGHLAFADMEWRVFVGALKGDEFDAR